MLSMQNRIVQLERTVLSTSEKLGETFNSLAQGIPKALEEMLLSKFEVNGAIPLTKDDINNMLSKHQASILEEIRSMNQSVANTGTQPEQQTLESHGTVYHYGGGFHMVPEDFVFPTSSCKNMWFRWHIGQDIHNIGPFRKLYKEYKMDIDQKRRPLVDKAHVVMEEIGKYTDDIVTAVNCGQTFDVCFPQLIKRLYGEEKFAKHSFRWMDLSYTTIYNVLSQEKKRKR